MTQEQINYIESEGFIEGFDCLKHEVPWVTPEAIYKLEKILTKEDYVMEVGSGGSTVFYAKHCMGVSSIETSEAWATKVMKYIYKNDIKHAVLSVIPEQSEIVSGLSSSDTDGVTVFSVDPQGGYNRSEILNAFLSKGISKSLRVIILDNYGHKGEFPLHYDRELSLGEDWEVFTYDYDRWAGSGTKILIRK